MSYAIPRVYKRLAPDFAELIPVDEWEAGLSVGLYTSTGGSGFWVYNGKQSHDDVFSSPKQDATHVAWYAKPAC